MKFYNHTALAFALMLAGCASTSTTQIVEPAYGFQSDGSYKLSPQELSKSCPQLTSDIKGEVPNLVNQERRTTQGRVLSGAFFIASMATGNGMISDFGKESAAEVKRIRSRLGAYNNQLETKKCPRVDIEHAMSVEKTKQASQQAPTEATAQ